MLKGRSSPNGKMRIKPRWHVIAIGEKPRQYSDGVRRKNVASRFKFAPARPVSAPTAISS